MQSKRKYRGLKKYESLLQVICKTESPEWLMAKEWENYLGIQGLSSHIKNNYDNLTEEEWEGCLGVACVISVIEGVNSSLFSLSKHLDISNNNPHLQNAFERLRVSGVFNAKRDIRNDPLLTGNGKDKELRAAADSERSAWCHIAGIGAGLIGLGKTLKSESEVV